MDKQAILDRLTQLRGQQKNLQANLWALDGAIQDCEFWLKELEKAYGADKQESLPGSDEKEVKVVDLQDVRFQETKAQNVKKDEVINYYYEGTD